MAKLGRKSKYSPELVRKITGLLKAGNQIEAVCGNVGIATSTFYDWQDKKPEFSEAIKRARSIAELKHIKRIDNAGKGGALIGKTVTQRFDKDGNVTSETTSETYSQPQWQADAWILERSYPDRWGRTRQEITGKDGGPLEIKAYDYSTSIASLAPRPVEDSE